MGNIVNCLLIALSAFDFYKVQDIIFKGDNIDFSKSVINISIDDSKAV